MKSVFNSLNKWSLIAAALVLGAAGIFELIDQTTMIILLVVLIASQSRPCLPAWKA
jgi:hypothetical protein